MKIYKAALPIISTICLTFFFSCTTFKKTKTPTIEKVPNIIHAIEQIQKNSDIPVLFPSEIPAKGQKTLYAFYGTSFVSPNFNESWWISANTSADCIVKNCEVIFLMAEKSGKLIKYYEPAPYKDSGKKTQFDKEEVHLINNTIGYYTPAHAEGDWHIPMVEWKQNNILYTLKWNAQNEVNDKEVLIDIANTALKH